MCVHNLGTTGFVSLGRESDTTTAYRGEQVVSPFPTLPTGLFSVWQSVCDFSVNESHGVT